MKTLLKNTVPAFLPATVAMVFGIGMSGCTYKLSEGITKEGTVSKAIFPKQDSAWLKNGIFPNLDNLRKIDAGVSKQDLYYLVGRPHFSEAQHASEWDYIFKFRQQDGSVQYCQYKVIFDENKLGQSFFWMPETCAQNIVVKPVIEPVAVPQAPPIQRQVITLDADALFEFNRWRSNDLKMKGRQRLVELANKISSYELTQRVSLDVIGHTDRLGGEGYNQNLSNLRANTVKQFLVSNGLKANSINAYGAGESQPKVTCHGVQQRASLINCLQPNRRVEVVVKSYR